MKYFAADTNFFLQCRDIDQIDWALATDSSDIVLLVPRQVIREIDRLKGDGNSRRAARARKVSPLLREVLKSSARSAKRTVGARTISVKFIRPVGDRDDSTTSLTHGDDAIVAEVRAYREQRPDDDLVIMTADFHMMLSADDAGIPHFEIPEEWKLPPEKSEEQKAQAELARRVAALEQRSPIVDFNFGSDSSRGEPCALVFYEPLGERAVRDLGEMIAAALPMVTDFSVSPDEVSELDGPEFMAKALQQFAIGFAKPPSDAQIQTYQGSEYPGWRKRIQTRLRSFHELLNQNSFVTPELTLVNRGGSPATRLLVTFETSGGITFLKAPRRRADVDSEGPFPLPPQAPSFFSFGDLLNSPPVAGDKRLFGNIARQMQPRPRGEFYESEEAETDGQIVRSFHCDEFRHQLKFEPISLEICPRVLAEGVVAGVLKCTAHATNMTEMSTAQLPLRIAVARGDIYAVAEQAFRELIAMAAAKPDSRRSRSARPR